MGNQQGVAETHKLQNRDQLFSQISQELQAKTSELKQRIVNSVGGNSGQNSGSKPRSGATDPGSGIKSNSIYQGIKIENDPLEREIYVKCPACCHRVFDSGLENSLV